MGQQLDWDGPTGFQPKSQSTHTHVGGEGKPRLSYGLC